MLAGSSLTTLHLHHNEIGDEGAKAIAAVLAGSSLASLDLGLNNISGSQGGVVFGPLGVRGELVKAWKAKLRRSLLILGRAQIEGQSGTFVGLPGLNFAQLANSKESTRAHQALLLDTHCIRRMPKIPSKYAIYTVLQRAHTSHIRSSGFAIAHSHRAA